MKIETIKSLEVQSPTKASGDVADIVGLQRLLIEFSSTAIEGQWASIANAPTYGELHGLTSMVEFCKCRWVIFRCGEIEYCLYVTPLVGAKKSGKQFADFSQDAQNMSMAIAGAVRSNGYKVADSSDKSLTWVRATERILKDSSYDDAMAIFAWAIEHEFWSGNVRSAPKFGKHFERLSEDHHKANTYTPKPKKKPDSGRSSAIASGVSKFINSQTTEEEPF